MRPDVPWMSKVDDLVLEWLDNHDIAAPPKVIHANLDTPVSYSQVNRRLWKLRENGLVEQDPERNDYYAITVQGRRYLHASDATAEEFPDLTREE